jgi:hypothetical protein
MYNSDLFKSIAPRFGYSYLVADCNYLIDNSDIVLGMVPLEIEFSIKSFDCLPTVECSVWRFNYRVLGAAFCGGPIGVLVSGSFASRADTRPLSQQTRYSTGRGRDTSYPVPPAQIPASGTTAPGSYLEL